MVYDTYKEGFYRSYRRVWPGRQRHLLGQSRYGQLITIKGKEKTTETAGFPESLPMMKIRASLTAVFEDGSKEQVFERTYEFNLVQSIDQ